jgi:hypothetical protein
VWTQWGLEKTAFWRDGARGRQDWPSRSPRLPSSPLTRMATDLSLRAPQGGAMSTLWTCLCQVGSYDLESTDQASKPSPSTSQEHAHSTHKTSLLSTFLRSTLLCPSPKSPDTHSIQGHPGHSQEGSGSMSASPLYRVCTRAHTHTHTHTHTHILGCPAAHAHTHLLQPGTHASSAFPCTLLCKALPPLPPVFLTTLPCSPSPMVGIK